MAADGAGLPISPKMRILMTRRSIFSVAVLALVLPFPTVMPVWAQGEEVRPLRLDGITLNGLHSYFTESWATLEVTVTNPNPGGRDGRVVGSRSEGSSPEDAERRVSI